MLVDNKFIYVSLPRCGSTSFYISCLRNNLDTKFFNQKHYERYNNIVDLNLNNDKLANSIWHTHEQLSELTNKFGDNYDIIGVNRDRHIRFISAWKHLIDMVDRSPQYNKNLVETLRALSLNDILFYKSEELISDYSQKELIYKFAEINGFIEYLDSYLIIMLGIIISPLSFYHNHNLKIKWFDFNKLYELEEWVSNKLGKSFKLEQSNSSKHIECNLSLNSEFISRYNSIYDYYDLPKTTKTIL